MKFLKNSRAIAQGRAGSTEVTPTTIIWSSGCSHHHSWPVFSLKISKSLPFALELYSGNTIRPFQCKAPSGKGDLLPHWENLPELLEILP